MANLLELGYFYALIIRNIFFLRMTRKIAFITITVSKALDVNSHEDGDWRLCKEHLENHARH